MGMPALAVDAEPVEGSRVWRGEIAVGAAAGRRIDKVETDLRRNHPGMLVEGRAGIALFVRGAVQLADYLDGDAFGARFEIEDFRRELVRVRHRRHAQIDLGI